jgi:hypothetical protein
MTQRLPSGELKYPSNGWGALAQNPTLEIGATGEAWISAVRSAWIRAGGTDTSFAEAFPDCARTEVLPVKHA